MWYSTISLVEESKPLCPHNLLLSICYNSPDMNQTNLQYLNTYTTYSLIICLLWERQFQHTWGKVNLYSNGMCTCILCPVKLLWCQVLLLYNLYTDPNTWLVATLVSKLKKPQSSLLQWHNGSFHFHHSPIRSHKIAATTAIPEN